MAHSMAPGSVGRTNGRAPHPSSGDSGRDRPLRAVVIGSGFGGLATAIRLQAAGVSTTLVERRAQLGGRAGQLRRDGYVFDTGPSLITAPAILEGVFAAAGRRLRDYVSLVPLDPFYRVWFHDGTWLDYTSDIERMKASMALYYPRDAARLEAFYADLRPIHDAVITEGLGARPFDTLTAMIRFAPRVARLNAWRPVARSVARHFHNWRHRFLYSFHPLFLGGNPFRAPSIFLMIPYLEKEGGVWYARGGMYSLVTALETVFREIGGVVHTQTPAVRVEVRGRQVTGVSVAGAGARAGSRPFLPADIVVSNADVGHTYGRLLGHVPRRRWTDQRLARVHQSMSCFLLYLGVRRRYPRLTHHTIIVGPRYRGLVRDIFDRKTLAGDFSMYVHTPSRTDPSMAPPGCESMYVLVPVPNAASGIDWKMEAPRMTLRVLDALEAWGLEGLSGALEVREVFTPDDFASQFGATLGNAFGIEPRLTQTAWFRPHNRSEEVSGLYLAGAGTHPGAGVPGVVLSAAATCHAIAQDFGFGEA